MLLFCCRKDDHKFAKDLFYNGIVGGVHAFLFPLM